MLINFRNPTDPSNPDLVWNEVFRGLNELRSSFERFNSWKLKSVSPKLAHIVLSAISIPGL